MNVAEQSADGTAFAGELEVATRTGHESWDVNASLTPHGHLVISASNAAVEAHITDPSTLDYCMTTYGTDPMYVCGRLTRESSS